MEVSEVARWAAAITLKAAYLASRGAWHNQKETAMNTPATIDDLFPSKYLKASDIEGEPIFTIREITSETMKNRETEKDESKPVIYFEEVEKGIVLNRTNANAIAGMYGGTLSEWIGKRVIIYTPVVEGFGKSAPAIRIKNQRPPADKKVLLAHYQKLYERAQKAKVDNLSDWDISASLSEAEIIDAGKRLKEIVEAAEAFL